MVAQLKGLAIAAEAPAEMRLSALQMLDQIEDLTIAEKAAIKPATADEIKMFVAAYSGAKLDEKVEPKVEPDPETDPAKWTL